MIACWMIDIHSVHSDEQEVRLKICSFQKNSDNQSEGFILK